MTKLVTFQNGKDICAGDLDAGLVRERAGSLPNPEGFTGREFNLDEVNLLAPIQSPPSVRDFFGFEEHVKTARSNRGLSVAPEYYQIPVFYFSNPSATIGPNDTVKPPYGTEKLDYELEVALVIGKDCSNVDVHDAWEYVAGFTIMNDWSARDLQFQEMAVGLGPSKGKDFATSIGPYLISLDEIEDCRDGDRHRLEMEARVNGRQISRGNLGDLFWTFPQMIAHASRSTILRAGDIIGSGTVGTGCILELRPENTGGWLMPGDEIELEVERLGILKNRVAN